MSGTNRLVVSRAVAEGKSQAEIAKELERANEAAKAEKKLPLKKK